MIKWNSLCSLRCDFMDGINSKIFLLPWWSLFISCGKWQVLFHHQCATLEQLLKYNIICVTCDIGFTTCISDKRPQTYVQLWATYVSKNNGVPLSGIDNKNTRMSFTRYSIRCQYWCVTFTNTCLVDRYSHQWNCLEVSWWGFCGK